MDNKIERYSYLNSIPINRPDIPDIGLEEYMSLNFNISDFEYSFKEWIGSKEDFVMTASGKMSIYLLFKALQLKGNIISAPLSCTMAFAPLVALDTEIKFVDINPDTFNIDTDEVEKQIDNNTSAIYAVHLGGVSSNMSKLRLIADKHNLILIEDCAQALGSEYNDKKLGTFGHYSTFSFAKNLWLAGGGGVLSDDTEVLDKIRIMQAEMEYVPFDLIKYRYERDALESKRGLSDKHDQTYYMQFLKNAKNANVGIDYKEYFQKISVDGKPTNLQACILMQQLKNLDKNNFNRKKNAQILIKELGNFFTFQNTLKQSPVYSKLYLYPNYNIDNKELIQTILKKGIDAKHLTKSHGIHFQERFDLNANFSKYIEPSILKNYMHIHDRIFALPISSSMPEEEIDYIISVLKQN